jgi:hypothetical protein
MSGCVLCVVCVAYVVCRDVPVAFIDSGLASLQKLIQVERMVMDRLFWPSDPVIQVRPAARGSGGSCALLGGRNHLLVVCYDRCSVGVLACCRTPA